MTNAVNVADALSNAPEHVEEAVKAIGRSVSRRQVFEAIYHHKSKVKTVGQIAQKTGLSRMRVLQAGRHLDQRGVIRQTRKDDDTAYEKIDFFHGRKKEIFRYLDDPPKLQKLATKRRPLGSTLPRVVSISTQGASVKRITVDDIGSFSLVKKVRSSQGLPPELSENDFKRGIQKIISEPGEFKDWGGEKSDLFTTRLRVDGKRVAAAFAFKGPGLKGRLVIGRMGKNGDQMPRLFQEEADVFLVQHWREIDPSVLDLMRSLAVAKSITTGHHIWYGIIDGQDSERLRQAYRRHFP